MKQVVTRLDYPTYPTYQMIGEGSLGYAGRKIRKCKNDHGEVELIATSFQWLLSLIWLNCSGWLGWWWQAQP